METQTHQAVNHLDSMCLEAFSVHLSRRVDTSYDLLGDAILVDRIGTDDFFVYLRIPCSDLEMMVTLGRTIWFSCLENL